MNKQGKMKPMNIAIWILLVFGIIIGGSYTYGLLTGKSLVTQESALAGSPQAVAVGGASGGATTIVTTDPTIIVAGQDAQELGTSVGSTLQYNANGGGFTTATSGTTTVKVGNKIGLFATNGTAFHNSFINTVDASKVGGYDASSNGIDVNVATFPVSIRFNGNATITENLFTTTGLVLANGLGTQNQTDLGVGKSYNLKGDMGGSSLDTTQPMTCVVEVQNGTQVRASPVGVALTFAGQEVPLKSQGKPVWYTSVTSDALANYYLFDVPEIKGSATKDYYLRLEADSNKRFSTPSRVVKTCYPKEWFINQDGKPTLDVADSLGTLKSIASYRYTFYFQ